MVMENADVLLIGEMLDPARVAVYYAAVRTASLIAFIYFAVSAIAVPKFARINSVGTREELQRFVSGIIRMMFWPSLLAALALAAIGSFALSLFGADFGEGYLVLLIALAGLVLRASTGPVEYLPHRHRPP